MEHLWILEAPFWLSINWRKVVVEILLKIWIKKCFVEISQSTGIPHFLVVGTLNGTLCSLDSTKHVLQLISDSKSSWLCQLVNYFKLSAWKCCIMICKKDVKIGLETTVLTQCSKEPIIVLVNSKKKISNGLCL